LIMIITMMRWNKKGNVNYELRRTFEVIKDLPLRRARRRRGWGADFYRIQRA